MSRGGVLDTSYLITLLDRNRPHHDAARRYYRHFLENDFTLLSTVVVSEFCIKQPLTDLPLHNLRVVPFNVAHALKCAELAAAIQRDPTDGRDTVKDDLKILAQAQVEGAGILITDDGRTMYRHADTLRTTGLSAVRPVRLADGFDRSFLDPDGQGEFTDQLLQDPPKS